MALIHVAGRTWPECKCDACKPAAPPPPKGPAVALGAELVGGPLDGKKIPAQRKGEEYPATIELRFPNHLDGQLEPLFYSYSGLSPEGVELYKFAGKNPK